MDMIFEDVGGLPVPRIAGVDVAPAAGDGVRFFDLAQAVEKFGRTDAYLRELYENARPRPDDPRVAKPGDPDAAAVQRTVLESRMETLRQARCPHVPPEHFAQFVELCRAKGLNPYCRHMYCETRPDPFTQMPRMVAILGIEGARVLAHRTEEYAGLDAIDFDYDGDGNPVSATCTVYRRRKGETQKDRFEHTVYWTDHYPGAGVSKMWDEKPHLCLSRPAEMGALAKAFPQEFDGLDTPEEFESSRFPRPPRGPKVGPAGTKMEDGRTFDPSTAQ